VRTDTGGRHFNHMSALLCFDSERRANNNNNNAIVIFFLTFEQFNPRAI